MINNLAKMCHLYAQFSTKGKNHMAAKIFENSENLGFILDSRCMDTRKCLVVSFDNALLFVFCVFFFPVKPSLLSTLLVFDFQFV